MHLSDWPHLFRPATDPAAPPLLLLHGTGGTEHDLAGLAERVAPGSALLAPRGRVSERGAARFFPRLGEGVFDPEQITPRIDELAAFVAAAARHYGLDTRGAAGRGLVALGFSNGANAAAALLRAGGAEVSARMHADAGHGLVPADLAEARAFLNS